MKKFWRRRSRKRRPIFGIISLGLLVVAAFVYAMFQGGFVSWFLFYSIMPISLYTLAVALFPMSSLTVHRHVNQKVLASGGKLQVTVSVSRHSRLPLLFLLVDDVLPASLGTVVYRDGKGDLSGARFLFFPGLGRQLQFTYMIDALPRGEHQLADIVLKTGDVFGFLQKKRVVKFAETIFVYPRYEEINQRAFSQQQGEGSRHGERHFQFDMTSVSGVRDYSQGDRLSWLDWKATARTNKLLTKAFDRSLNDDQLVCIDGRVSNDDKEGESFERAVMVAASLVHFGVRQGSAVGFVSFGHNHVTIPPASGQDQQWRIFNHLARIQADKDGKGLPSADQTMGHFSRQMYMFYIAIDIDHALLELVDKWLRRQQKVCLFLIKGDAGKQDSAEESQRLAHLRRRGVDVYMIGANGLNEGLKAGIHDETS